MVNSYSRPSVLKAQTERGQPAAFLSEGRESHRLLWLDFLGDEP